MSYQKIIVHSQREQIDMSQFVEAEKELNSFDFYATSRVLKAALHFCGFIVAAYENEKLIGFTYVFKCDEKSTYFFSYIWISSDYRSKGIGDNVHKLALKEAFQRGAKKLYATCSPKNINSLRLLLRNNWVISSYNNDFYGKNEHRFILQHSTQNVAYHIKAIEKEISLNDLKKINNLLLSGYIGKSLIESRGGHNLKLCKATPTKNKIETKRLEVKYEINSKLNTVIISIYPERVFYVEGLPLSFLPIEYIQYLSMIFCFATIVNLHDFNGDVELSADFKIPQLLIDYFKTYNSIQNSIRIFTESLTSAAYIIELPASHQEKVVLLSGGKDSVYQLLRLLDENDRKNLISLYLSGPTINIEYMMELENLFKLTDYFNTKLKIIKISHGDYGYNSMRVRNRASWRGLLLLSIAAIFSKDIYWGTTYDKELHTDIKKLCQKPQGSIYFGDAFPTINLVKSLLHCDITSAPSEYEIYKYMYLNKREILNQTYSCFNPLGKCDLEKDWEKGCLKCKTLHIYRKKILNINLTKIEKEYLNSFYWMGDPDFHFEG